MVILLVLFQVPCELVDLLREHRNLHLWRAGIRRMTAGLGDDDFFLSLGQHGAHSSMKQGKCKGGVNLRSNQEWAHSRSGLRGGFQCPYRV